MNKDLFWSLRGGGGPSFGIVVSTTVKTHPNPPYTAFFHIATGNSTEAYIDLLETWNKYHNALSDSGWSGVWPFFGNSLFLTMLAQGTPPAPAANATMLAFVNATKALPGVNITTSMSVYYPNFQAFNFDNLVDSSRGFGFNFTAAVPGPPHSVTSSWLLPRNLTAPANARQVAEIYANLTGGVA